jgi:hypothetical protein
MKERAEWWLSIMLDPGLNPIKLITPTSFGVITPFFGLNYATFLRTNLSVEIKAKTNAKKCLFA